MTKELFKRSNKNPILLPNPNNQWESLKVYNCGAIYDNKQHHLFYRAVGAGENWHSVIGHAVSKDGENFTRFSTPVLDSETALELRGLEDPRVTKVGDTFLMAYAAYDGIEPRLNIATSPNLNDWTKRGQAFRDFHFIENGGYKVKWESGKPVESRVKNGNDERSKSGGIFPEKINGKYWMLFNEYFLWLAESDNGLSWEYIKEPILSARKGNFFDNTFVEMGPPPIKTEKGWLVLYHGIDDSIYYRLGFLLLDLHDPSKIIYRSKNPIFWPQERYELSGLVDILPGGLKMFTLMTELERNDFIKKARDKGIMPKVTFCCGAVVVDGILRIYYGAGDTSICTATAKLCEILDLVDIGF